MPRMDTGSVDDPAWRWEVDGVSPQAQAAARHAAHSAGLPLSAWIEAAIMHGVERGKVAEKAVLLAEDPRPARRYF